MLLIGDFSKYPVVEVVTTITSSETIVKLEKMITTHGLIQEIRTDNGPPFHSQDLAEYLEHCPPEDHTSVPSGKR